MNLAKSDQSLFYKHPIPNNSSQIHSKKTAIGDAYGIAMPKKPVIKTK